MSNLEKTAFTIGFSFIVFALTLDLTPKEAVCLVGYTIWCVAIFVARIFDLRDSRNLDREFGLARNKRNPIRLKKMGSRNLISSIFKKMKDRHWFALTLIAAALFLLV